MASGHHHLQNEATEPSETGQQAAQRFLQQLASIPANSDVVPSSSPFYNTNNFIALHAVCGNPDWEDSSQRPDYDDAGAAAAADDDDNDDRGGDDFDNDPSYGFSDLPYQAHGSYNSGSSDEFRLNDNPNCAQLDAGEGVMGCTGAELCTSGRYDQGPSTLPDGAEYCMTVGREAQTELKTTVPSRLAEEHEEQQSPDLNCGVYFQLQTVSSGYMTGTLNAAAPRDRQNRFHPILDAFLESLQTDRKENQQAVGQQDQDTEHQPARASASESPAPPCSHTQASALAAVVAAGNHSHEEQDEENEAVSSVESREDDDNTD
ncbi:uncharacterized protein LOC124149851 [Haliotis rufescens]|uniref:uncharacterized protein LOC124149851 n=1 Tax=Haliotis rufescens TaxID=6454 RepID=UPI00201EFFCE|nr:uncharacterized protein LOC124149851 [Haliotis rufescens]